MAQEKTMRRVDFDVVRQAALDHLKDLAPQLAPHGQQRGHEWVALNPVRSDDTIGSFSINLNTGQWSDFATADKGGDAISYYAYVQNLSYGDAAQALAEQLGLASNVPASRRNGASQSVSHLQTRKPEPVIPIPSDAPDPADWHPKLGKPTQRWVYRNFDQRPLLYIYRFDQPDGGKQILPRTWCWVPDRERYQWRWRNLPPPRPLYGLDRLHQNPNSHVIIVEGEKCRDALQAASQKWVVLTWNGGSHGVANADWSPLTGRKVIIWPDNDAPGENAAEAVAEELVRAGNRKVRIVQTPKHKPEGWDVADALASGWTAAKIWRFIAQNLREPEALREPPIDHGPGPEVPEKHLEPLSQSGHIQEAAGPLNHEFRPLGYDRNYFYYLAFRSRQIVPLTPAQHTKHHLLRLAPRQWWERHYPGTNGPSWDTAVNALYRACESKGVYDPDKVRGRGAWWDDESVVIHLGDRLLVDGKERQIEEYDSRYVYEAARMLPGPSYDPLSNSEANKVRHVCRHLRWQRAISAELLAGWIVLAPICGALSWRPHIWLTGSSQAGKTTALRSVVRPLLGEMQYHLEGETTAAGIRQLLQTDAFPVLFDEADNDNPASRARVQSILEMMRGSSAESGARTAKGSAGQTGAHTYIIRSMFCLASIGVGLKHVADQSRTSVLELRAVNPQTQDEIDAVQEQKLQLDRMTAEFTHDFARALFARTARLIPTIRRNAKTFGSAITTLLGNQRQGEQYGHLLAGAFSLTSRKEISYDDAYEWCASRDWQEYTLASTTRDEARCLHKLLQTPVRVHTEQRATERLIGELVGVCCGLNDSEINPWIAHDTLARHGLRAGSKRNLNVVANPYELDQEYLWVATDHQALSKIFADTLWANAWAQVLPRLDGALSVADAGIHRFGAMRLRSIGVPLRLVVDPNQDSEG